ncbi:MAG: cyclic nucleotide-binding domain-containing protein [Desulfobacterales bacterium]|nr:cyclic nucleotide-binding domain-containing protein [Desulfobacterales bacterium]
MEKISIIHEQMIWKLIRNLEFFENFSLDEKKKLFEFYKNIYSFEKGEVLINEGDTDNCFYILIGGIVSVCKGKDFKKIATLNPGDIFGEISFITNTPRISSIKADDSVLVVRVNNDMLNELNVEMREKIKDKIIERLGNRLNNMNNVLIDFFKL